MLKIQRMPTRVDTSDERAQPDNPPKALGIEDLLPEWSLHIIDPDQLIGYQKAEILSEEVEKFHVEYAD